MRRGVCALSRHARRGADWEIHSHRRKRVPPRPAAGYRVCGGRLHHQTRNGDHVHGRWGGRGCGWVCGRRYHDTVPAEQQLQRGWGRGYSAAPHARRRAASRVHRGAQRPRQQGSLAENTVRGCPRAKRARVVVPSCVRTTNGKAFSRGPLVKSTHLGGAATTVRIGSQAHDSPPLCTSRRWNLLPCGVRPSYGLLSRLCAAGRPGP